MSTTHDEVEEAVADAQRETARFSIADEFRPPPDHGPIAPYSPAIGPLAPSSRLDSECQHIEDLHKYPVGNGAYVLRVERDEPKKWMGAHVGGFLGDFTEHFKSPEEFAQRFGGNRYTIYVRSILSNGQVGPDGRPQQRTVATLRLTVPGNPVIQASRQPSEDVSMTPSTTGVTSAAVEIERMRMAERADSRREQTMAQMSQAQAPLLRELDEQAEKRTAVVRETLNAQIARLEADNRAKQEALAQRDKDIDNLRREVLDAKQRHNTDIIQLENKITREQDQKHQGEISRLRDERVRDAEQTRREYESRIEQLRAAHAAEMVRVQEQERNERARIMDASKREQDVLRSSYEQRLADRGHEIDRLRSEHQATLDRELRSAKHVHDTLVATQQAQLTSQITMLASERDRVASELSVARTELDRVRRELYKSPLKAIEEAQTLMGHIQGGDEEKPNGAVNSWQGVAAAAVQSLVPGLMGLMQPRPMVPVQPNGHGAPPGAVRALPPAQAQHPPPMSPPRQGRRPPSWITPPAPPAPGEAPHMPPGADAPVAFARPRPRTPIPSGAGAPPARAEPPLSGGPEPMPPLPTDIVLPPDEVHPAQVAPTSQPSRPTPAAGAPSDEQVAAAIARLSTVIVTGERSPAEFAQEFVAAAGPAFAAMAVASMTPAQFVDEITSRPDNADNPIGTRAGRAYVSELWTETRKLVG